VKDIFAVQDEIAAIIASSPQAQACGRVAAQRRGGEPGGIPALRGGHAFWALRTNEALKRAQGLFTQAIALDSIFRASLCGLGRLRFGPESGRRGFATRRAGRRLRSTRAPRWKRPCSSIPTWPRAYAASGNVLSIEERWDESQAAFEKGRSP